MAAREARPTEAILEQVLALSRREALARGLSAAGWGAFAIVLGTGAVETLRFFRPRVVYQPPTRVRIGTPEGFAQGSEGADVYGVVLVDEHWKPSHRFFLVRERQRLYALTARCAHLGCTVNWFGELRVFKCPCHGSEYHSNGANFAGPAPRPLDRLRIELAGEGQIVVDTAITYGPERFDADGAFVRL